MHGIRTPSLSAGRFGCKSLIILSNTRRAVRMWLQIVSSSYHLRTSCLLCVLQQSGLKMPDCRLTWIESHVKFADAWDNMVTCDGCDRRMHLRCLIPPQTGAPSGQFFCPACDVGCGKFCCTPCGCKTPLRYNSGQDPHINEVLIKYLCSGREEACLPLKC